MVEKYNAGAFLGENPLLHQWLIITEVQARAVDLALSEPMSLSFGKYESRPSGWLALTGEVDGHRVTGYGEGATLPKPAFTDDYRDNIAENMALLARNAAAERTVGAMVNSIQNFNFGSNRFPTARLATEMAVLDAAAKAQNMSIREAIGISPDITEVPFGKSIGGDTTASILRQANEALQLDARKIKIKISPSLFEPAMNAIHALQSEHPGLELMVDANGGFDPHDPEHLRMLAAFDQRGLLMIEEPVSRVGASRGLDAVRALRAALPELQTPVCLDDCLQSMDDCRVALDEGLASIINVKPGRVGSFLRSLELVDYAAAQGAEVMVGGMLEATPGRCMTTLLGAYCLTRGFAVPGDLSLAQERLAEDLVPPERQLTLGSRGTIVLPNGPGWGF